MPSEIEFEPGLFVSQSIFASNGQAILMGVLQKGELNVDTTTSFNGKVYRLIDIQVFTKHTKSIKATDKGAKGLGIVLANSSLEEAQGMINKELLFI